MPTPNIGITQYEQDKVLSYLTTINQDNAKIDSAFGEDRERITANSTQIGKNTEQIALNTSFLDSNKWNVYNLENPDLNHYTDYQPYFSINSFSRLYKFALAVTSDINFTSASIIATLPANILGNTNDRLFYPGVFYFNTSSQIANFGLFTLNYTASTGILTLDTINGNSDINSFAINTITIIANANNY